MNIESFRAHCIAKRGVTEEFPFDKTTLVFKVMGKMFALTDVDLFEGINLKVDPEEGAAMRDTYDFVQEAYHMKNRHWVTVVVTPAVSEPLLKAWIDRSYELVVQGLTKSKKSALNSL
ncbi:MAG: MmcQ/YjbR family DNA-binding protein [Cytophagales bacterium]|nr:MmcQ/YjbR family DNA-binding protein [Cytophagales bacterium]